MSDANTVVLPRAQADVATRSMALLDKLLRYLRARGTSEVVGECMLENLKLASLARHAGFDVKPGSSGDVVTLRLQLNPPTLDKT